MGWEHVQPTSVNLTYLFFGAFTSTFMLLSGYVKNRLYLGEASVAFLTGIIFGPLAANLFNPTKWKNQDLIIIECSRVVIVIQCFAVAVDLRRKYIEKNWRSLAVILGPVMVWGWMVSSLAVHFMARDLSWRECMVVASCFNAIDPILAATVINRGKFSKRVPRHLRELLLAESACNDITTTLVLELSTYLVQYSHSPRQISYRFFALTFAYEVLFGAVAGLVIGRCAHHAVRFADRKGVIDRDSFLAFYFVLALFCAGFGALLGVDEVLLGFCAGYAFDRNDWFQTKTEESDISNVVDLLLNLSYFVLAGSIIPWHSYNNPSLGIVPWRLCVGTLMIFLFRRLPIFILLKSFIPGLRTWRENLFYAHFGPIGAGAIFSALLVKSQFGNNSYSRQSTSAGSMTSSQLVISIWPLATFVVVCSTIVHGSSVPLFQFSKRINNIVIEIDTGPSALSVSTSASSAISSQRPESAELAPALTSTRVPHVAPYLKSFDSRKQCLAQIQLQRLSCPEMPSHTQMTDQVRPRRFSFPMIGSPSSMTILLADMDAIHKRAGSDVSVISSASDMSASNETVVERRRRFAALGLQHSVSRSDSEDSGVSDI